MHLIFFIFIKEDIFIECIITFNMFLSNKSAREGSSWKTKTRKKYDSSLLKLLAGFFPR